MTGRSRTLIIIIAAGLLAIAVVLKIIIHVNSPLTPIIDMLESRGYTFVEEDIYVLGGQSNTTIAELLEKSEGDAKAAIDKSKAAGFSADINTVGDVNILLAQCEEGVITMYLLNDTPQLCFVQTNEGEVLKIK